MSSFKYFEGQILTLVYIVAFGSRRTVACVTLQGGFLPYVGSRGLAGMTKQLKPYDNSFRVLSEQELRVKRSFLIQ